MDLRERFHDPEEDLRAMADGIRASMWTSAPGVITAVDSSGRYADIQLTVKSQQRMPDGTVKAVDIPVLSKVPLHFPSGGGATMTFPVKPGDECLVNFSSRPVDAWEQSGGVQSQIDARTHDLSDGFAFVGFSSQPNAISNISTDAVQLRSSSGNTVISLKEDDAKIKATNATVAVSPTAVEANVSGMLIKVTSSRVDLGGLGGDGVRTAAGISTKVFAVL